MPVIHCSVNLQQLTVTKLTALDLPRKPKNKITIIAHCNPFMDYSHLLGPEKNESVNTGRGH